MVKYRGAFYALEPNHGELDRITRRGRVSRVLDVSLLFGHVVPTAIAVDAKRHRFYIGTLTTFPLVSGAARVLVVTPHGRVTRIISGFTGIVGLAVRRHRLWVLETSSAGFPQPGTGSIIRLTRRGRTTVVSGLTFPTAMTFGPKGGLYVTTRGFGFPPGAGRILRVHR
jgi:sugar lactone lactonase YvrE